MKKNIIAAVLCGYDCRLTILCWCRGEHRDRHPYP